MTGRKEFEFWTRLDGPSAAPRGRDEGRCAPDVPLAGRHTELRRIDRLAHEAMQASGASFVAIARCVAGGRGASFVAVAGPPDTAVVLGHASLVPIWRAAIEARRTICVRRGERVGDATGEARLLFQRMGIESVLAAPVEMCGTPAGLLVAGLPALVRADEARECLEEDARAAALALAEERRVEGIRIDDQWLAAVLDSMENGVLLIEPGGRVKLANSRLPSLLGITAERMAAARTFDELVSLVRANFKDPRGAEARWREIQRREDEVAWDEVELARPTTRVLERFARPVRAPDGERLGWLELYRETTGERLLRSRLPQAEKMAALGQLVSGIAHELNNPLTSILGYAQLLRGHTSGSEEVQRIFDEAQRAGAIVRNLLLFARDERPERRRVDVNDVVKQTVALRDYVYRVENIRLALELEPDLPLVLADSHQLQQVVLNLLMNAEQALEHSRGHGLIRVRTRSARHKGQQRIHLEIHDSGPGIPREILPRIFDPFFTTKPAGVGTGLGLSIVYSIAQDHGGEVCVESEPGHGATFIVELPAAPLERRGARGERAPVAAAAPQPEPPRGERRRILVVEDEPTVASLVADVLRDEGHDVETLLDSVAALERLNRADFDLLICDLKMPRLDGRALYEDAVRKGRISRERVLFITGDTLRPRTLDFVEGNRLPYLSKPFLVEELTRTVRGLFRGASEDHAARLPGTREQAAGE